MPKDALSHATKFGRWLIFPVFLSLILVIGRALWNDPPDFIRNWFIKTKPVMLTMKDSEISSDFSPEMKVYFFGEEVGKLEKEPFYFRSNSASDWMSFEKCGTQITESGNFGVKIHVKENIHGLIGSGWKAKIKRELYISGEVAIHLYPGIPAKKQNKAESGPGAEKGSSATQQSENQKSAAASNPAKTCLTTDVEIPIESDTIETVITEIAAGSEKLLTSANKKLGDIITGSFDMIALNQVVTDFGNLAKPFNKRSEKPESPMADLASGISHVSEQLKNFKLAPLQSNFTGVTASIESLATRAIPKYKSQESALSALHRHPEWRRHLDKKVTTAKRHMERPENFPENLPSGVAVWIFEKGDEEFFVLADTGEVWMRAKDKKKSGPAKRLTSN